MRARDAGRVTEEHVFEFRYAEEIRPGVALLRDYNFKKPTQNLEGLELGKPDKHLEYYDYPGLYEEAGVGSNLAKVRLEELRVARKVGHGKSTCSNLLPGFTFRLTDFPRDSLNDKYLIVSVTTRAAQPQALEETAGSDGV
jgi:type VI secretion system secreted protein VgrG